MLWHVELLGKPYATTRISTNEKNNKQHDSKNSLCLYGHLGPWFAILQSTKQTINVKNGDSFVYIALGIF